MLELDFSEFTFKLDFYLNILIQICILRSFTYKQLPKISELIMYDYINPVWWAPLTFQP